MGWAVFAAALEGRALSPTSPYVVAPLALAVGVAIGRLAAPYVGHRASALTLLGTTTYLLLAVLWTAGPAKGPLAYANANAALAVQLIALSGLVMTRTTGRWRAVAAVSALVALAVVDANASKAGLAVAVPLLAVVALGTWRPARRRSTMWIALLAAAATVASAAAAVGVLAYRPTWPSWALSAFDPARKTLWHDALGLWARHPVSGAGPGSYEQLSTLGRDPDTAAAHSSVLQVGAETGTIGVALFAAIVLAGLLLVRRSTPSDAVIAAGAWTALLVHSFADHLLDFAPVVLAAGIVLGLATASQRSEQLDVPEGERPLVR